MENSFDFDKLTNQPIRDHYGRKFPFRVSLVNEEVFIGRYAGSSSNDEGCDSIWFKIIEDINEWITNKDYIGIGMIYLKPEEIKDMLLFNGYRE